MIGYVFPGEYRSGTYSCLIGACSATPASWNSSAAGWRGGSDPAGTMIGGPRTVGDDGVEEIGEAITVSGGVVDVSDRAERGFWA